MRSVLFSFEPRQFQVGVVGDVLSCWKTVVEIKSGFDKFWGSVLPSICSLKSESLVNVDVFAAKFSWTVVPVENEIRFTECFTKGARISILFPLLTKPMVGWLFE